LATYTVDAGAGIALAGGGSLLCCGGNAIVVSSQKLAGSWSVATLVVWRLLMRRTRTIRCLLVGLCLAGVTGCSLILGLQDAKDRPGAPDAATDTTVADTSPTQSDASVVDAQTDGAAMDGAAALTLVAPSVMNLSRFGSKGAFEITLSRAVPVPLKVVVSPSLTGVIVAPLTLLAGQTSATLNIDSSGPEVGVTAVTITAAHEPSGTKVSTNSAMVVPGAPGSVDQALVVGATLDATMSLHRVAAMGDGSLIVGGTLSAGNKRDAVAKLLPNGAVDTSFGAAGFTELAGGERLDTMAVDDAGYIYGTCAVGAFPPRTLAAVRIDPTGKADSAFMGTTQLQVLYGAGGLVLSGPFGYLTPHATNEPSGVRVGRISAAGFDPNFGDAGFLATSTGLYQPRIGAVLSNGKILVTSKELYPPSVSVHRLAATGAVDPTFGEGDAGAFSFESESSDPRLATLKDGRIVVTGGFDTQVAAPNGSLVRVFTSAGQVAPGFTVVKASADPRHVLVDSTDRIIVVATDTGGQTSVRRLNPSGTVDASLPTITVNGSGDAILDRYGRLVLLAGNSIKRFWL